MIIGYSKGTADPGGNKHTISIKNFRDLGKIETDSATIWKFLH